MKTNYVLFKEKSTQHRISLEAILYVRSNGRHTRMYVGQSMYNISHSIQALLEQPEFANLVQIHRSFAVNICQVTAINRHELFIENLRLPIGRNFSQNVLEAFNNTT
ncbi:LytTR family DNA-binding domain-containing protein [Flavihumibacter profundi]|uniref:LytTR family DNA-binding domain-containing protein n=1 Tax=Flavihumibacter profundi TaxID=2716883 RepID=UPI001CC4F215|nr:LytTR family DNA-binding domain-containing protein [Flavihumibacter profundi]MBZ5857591.1 LytTR family transcriptional regulator [Flavihumibacter profundi]